MHAASTSLSRPNAHARGRPALLPPGECSTFGAPPDLCAHRRVRATRMSEAKGGQRDNQQALTELLVQMDGFQAESASSGASALVVAATNRADMIDRALLRPGRFDRRVEVGPPDTIEAREALLKIHTRNKPLARDVDLYSVATRTEGLSGAELAAVLEEAAVSAAVRNDTVIDAEDIEISLDDARFNHDRA